MHQSSCVWKTQFPCGHPAPLVFSLSVSSSEQNSELGLKGFGEDIPFKTKCSKVSYTLHTADL